MRCFFKARVVSWCVFIASVLGAPVALSAADQPKAVSNDRPAAVTASVVPGHMQASPSYGDLPLSFEANQGQANRKVRFLSRGSGYTFFLTPGEAVLSFSPDRVRDRNQDQDRTSAVLHMRLNGSNPAARIRGVEALPGTSNYFIGQDPREWHTGVPTYRKVAYENIYPGIDLVYYGNQRQLEYDFVVSPGSDPRAIQLSIGGASRITVDEQGNLVLHSDALRGGDGNVRLLAPRAYQDIDGRRREIAGQWRLARNNLAAFRLGSYDHSKALVIDPVLMYSSFLGGSQNTSITRIATDSAGNAYVAGYTASGDFPASPTPESSTFGGGAASRGAFVAKIDPTGSSLLYTTYLSGSVDEQAAALAVDAAGNVYVAGNTHSPDFPVLGAFQSACSVSSAGMCSDAFLTKIASAGNALVYSTYLGGTGDDSATGLAVDANGNAYVAGVTSSKDFPATTGSAQAKCGGTCNQNAFVAKFNPLGQSLVYATYLGGSASDGAADIAVDASGSAYIAGQTSSPDFPVVGAFQKTCTIDASSSTGACLATAFIAKLKADGSALTYSTYLGGSLGSQAAGIALDSLGNAYVTGNTKSSDFPILNAFQKSCGKTSSATQCAVNAFVTKLNAAGSALAYSTYLGGSTQDAASGIAVDAAGNAHVVGTTASSDFPTLKPLQSKLNGASDAFVAALSSTGKALKFSTFHGGSSTEFGSSISLDAKGNIYVAGQTSSTDFPTLTPFQSSCAGTCSNAFVTKMSVISNNTAASITATQGTPQSTDVSTAFPVQLIATVLDSTSNPVVGVPVTFTAPSSGASGTFTGNVTTITVNTDASGDATETFTANSTANTSTTPYTVTATVGGVTAPADFLLINVGAPSAIAATGGTPQTAPVSTAFATNLSATVKDSAGNLVPGASVVFLAPASGASGAFADTTTNTTTQTTGTSGVTLGVATATMYTANATAGGPYMVTAKVGAVGPANFLLINAGAPNSIAVVSSTNNQSATVNTSFTNLLQATVKDSNGNLVPGATVTFTAPASGASGTFANSSITTTTTTGTSGGSLGIATATVFTANTTSGNYNVSATVGAFSVNFSLTNTAGAANSITVVSGTNNQSATEQTAFGTALQATVLDSFGNPVPSVSVTFTPVAGVSGATGTFTGSATVTTSSSGVATAPTLTASATAGAFTVSANTTPTALVPAAVFSLTVNVGAPATIAVVASTNNQTVPINTAYANLQATVKDSGGNLVPNASVTFTAVAGTHNADGAFSGGATSTVTTNGSGVATAGTLTANSHTGSFTVTANTTPAVTTAATFSLTITHGAANTVTASAGTPQTTAAGTAFSTALQASVTDGGSNPIAGVAVTFTAPSSGASGVFSNNTNTITVNTADGTGGTTLGVATAPFTANCTLSSPTFSVTAAVSGVATPATYTLTITVGPTKTVTPTAGSTPQTATVRTAFATNLGATLTDCGNNLEPAGITVSFTTIPGAGAAAGTFADSGTGTTTAMSNSSGVATAAVYTANHHTGSYTVSGTVTGATTNASYALSNTVGLPSIVTPTPASMTQSTAVNTAFVALAATVTDQDSNPVGAGIPVTFLAPSTGATGAFSNATNTIVINTSGAGTVSAPFTANTTAGPAYNVSAMIAFAGATNGNYSLTNVPGPPATITMGANTTPQNAAVTNAFGTALSGTVTDSFGNTVLNNVNVKLTAPAGAVASGTFANSSNTSTVTTTAAGTFTATAFTANSVAGSYIVSAASTTGTATFQYQLVNTDFSFALTSTSPSIYIQGTNVPLSTSSAPMVTVTALPPILSAPASYTGTITLACMASTLPAGVTCPSFTPASAVFADGAPASVLSAATVNVSATTPVGLYQANPVTIVGTDGSAKAVMHSAGFGLAVQCTYSLGNSGTAGTLPQYSPLVPDTPYTFSVTENAGGSACPWNDLTATSGITGITTTSGTASPTGNQILFDVTPLSANATAPQTNTVSVSYFQVTSAGTTGTSTLNVTQELPISLTGGTGTTSTTITASSITTATPGTLAFPTATGLAMNVSTICGAQQPPSTQNPSGIDSSGNNWFISCSASQISGNTATLNVTIGAPTPALRHPANPAQLGLLYSAGLGFPAIVFMGLGAAAFGPKRKRTALRRIASLLGILLLLALLVLLPACGGGFRATFATPSQVGTYTITVMGYVTDTNNNVIGIEIFTVPMNVVK